MMTVLPRAAATVLALVAPALAQETDVGFGGLTQDTSAPVEVASDSLAVDQAEGTATFSGNVLVTQGTLRLAADRIRVVYAGEADDGRIRELRAEGSVTLANGAEAAEAEAAVYDIDAGRVVMTGNVVLTQGQTALSSERLVLDLNSGTGSLEGRVRSVFQPGSR